jgi:hypothetical protein
MTQSVGRCEIHEELGRGGLVLYGIAAVGLTLMRTGRPSEAMQAICLPNQG